MPSAETRALVELGNRGWDKLNAIRAQMALDFDLRDVRALHPMDPGRVELNARLRESGASAAEALDHVLRCAESEARHSSPPSVRWLSGALFGERQWRRYTAMSVADAAARAAPGTRRRSNTPAPEYAGAQAALEAERARAAARAAPPPEPEDLGGPLSPEDLAAVREFAARLGHGPTPAPIEFATEREANSLRLPMDTTDETVTAPSDDSDDEPFFPPDPDDEEQLDAE